MAVRWWRNDAMKDQTGKSTFITASLMGSFVSLSESAWRTGAALKVSPFMARQRRSDGMTGMRPGLQPGKNATLKRRMLMPKLNWKLLTKKRESSPHPIGETPGYFRDFNQVAASTSTAMDLYEKMLALHPNRINPRSLWATAKA